MSPAPNTFRLSRVGLVVNPSAGGGAGLTFARQAIQALAPDVVVAGAGEMGADALADLPGQCSVLDWQPHRGKSRTDAVAKALAASGVDAIIVVGGDGTLADVALRLHLEQLRASAGGQGPPILGIGAGSANVGPLITCRGDALDRLAGARLGVHPVDGLIAAANGVDLGLGFNDVVISMTVLATVDGRIVDVDAAGKQAGLNVPRDPQGVWTGQTRVVKHSPAGETLVAQGAEVETLIVGLPDERFYGKAIAGGLLLSSLLGEPAGCLVCDHLLVRTRLDPALHHRSEPVVSRYVGLAETDVLAASGFRLGSALCADGNPLLILHEADQVQVRVRCGLARHVRIEE